MAANEPDSGPYTNRHGERCSLACGQGRHAECTETLETCNCTYRGLHKTLHRYASFPDIGLEQARQWRLENIFMPYAPPMASGSVCTHAQPIVETMLTLEPSWTDEKVVEYAEARVRAALEACCVIVRKHGDLWSDLLHHVTEDIEKEIRQMKEMQPK